MAPTVSVLIPSRLSIKPDTNRLWIERAIASVLAQTVKPLEIIVGLDPAVLLPNMGNDAIPIRPVNARIGSVAAAVNAAAIAADGEFIAPLEDDDLWEPTYLQMMLRLFEEPDAPDFLSCSQALCDQDGNFHHHFDFPTESGWLMHRSLWHEMDGFDVRFRLHADNDFLGRLNEAGKRRLHLVEDGCTMRRPYLLNLRHFTPIRAVPGMVTLPVKRCFHADSGTAAVLSGEKEERSNKEHAALEVLYGVIPW